MSPDHFPILVVAVPLFVAFLIPLVGLKTTKLAFPMVVIAIGFSLFAAIGIAAKVFGGQTLAYHLGGWSPPWGIEYQIDALNAFMILLVCVIALIIAIYSKRSIVQERPKKEVHFYCVYLLLFVGLLGMLTTGDMFNLYVFLEISSLTAYALIGIGDEKAAFSAFKYVVVGTIGACFYLVGVGYLYIITGSLNMAQLAGLLPALSDSNVVLVAGVFFTIGMGIKMGLFPLHTWLPGAYTHAPSAVSAYIAPLMTKVAAYAIIRVMFTVFKPEFTFDKLPLAEILGWTAAIAIVYGSVIAITQTDFKRMLAYSSISQVGYIVLGLALGNRQGFQGALLHILNHAFMKACLFAVAGAIIYRQGTRAIEQFGFLHRKMPLTAVAFGIAALSMIGIPPTAGFFSKWYLILGAVTAHNWAFVGVILLSSLLNAVYFFKVIEHVFLKPMRGLKDSAVQTMAIQRREAPGSMLIPILILAAGILVLGFASNWIVEVVLGPAVPAGII